MNKISRALCVIAIGMAAHSAAHAGNVYEACKVMTGKLALEYRLRGYPKQFRLDEKDSKDPIKDLETTVGVAYLTTKRQLDAQWEGFFDWSVLAVLKAIEASESPNEFRVQAFQNCVAAYK